jgi:hypothetical protein
LMYAILELINHLYKPNQIYISIAMSFVAHPEGVRASSAVLPSSPPPLPNTQHNRPPCMIETVLYIIHVLITGVEPKRLRRSRHEPIEPIPEYHAPTDIESDLPEDSIPEIPSASSDSPTMDEYCARNRLDGKKRKGYLEIKGAMSRSRVSLIHFLSMWIHDDSNAGGKGSSYSSQQSRVKQVTDFFDDKETQTVLRRIRIPEETAKTDALQQTQSALKEELDGLVGRPPFVKWSADNSPVLCVPASAHMIKSCAGRLYKLLAYLLTNPRQSKEENTEVEEGSEAASEKKRGYAIFFITLILMYARAPRMSDQAATIVGLYFHATGASKRTMDVVGKIGVAPSYTTLRDRIRLVAERGDVGNDIII